MPEDPATPTPDPTETLRQQLAAANARIIQAELKAHAIRAGMIDLDCLKLLDASKLQLSDDGIADGENTVANMKRDKPWLFAKAAPNHSTSSASPSPKPDPVTTPNAKKMSHEEWQAARARLIKGM